jgi:hypothetical protein
MRGARGEQGPGGHDSACVGRTRVITRVKVGRDRGRSARVRRARTCGIVLASSISDRSILRDGRPSLAWCQLLYGDSNCKLVHDKAQAKLYQPWYQPDQRRNEPYLLAREYQYDRTWEYTDCDQEYCY